MVKKMIPLTELRAGEHGKVTAFQGGFGLARRLEAMGLRIGTKVTKISDQFMRGPVTIKAGHTGLALGFGMAGKITVEIEK